MNVESRRSVADFNHFLSSVLDMMHSPPFLCLILNRRKYPRGISTCPNHQRSSSSSSSSSSSKRNSTHFARFDLDHFTRMDSARTSFPCFVGAFKFQENQIQLEKTK